MADRAKIDQEADWHWNELIDISKVRTRQTGKDLFASEGLASRAGRSTAKSRLALVCTREAAIRESLEEAKVAVRVAAVL